MDRAVIGAYGWTDIQSECEFILEFDDDEEDDSGRPKKKRYRYRWHDGIRDEVLARLLELNRQHALEEGQIIPDSLGESKPSDRRTKKVTRKNASEKSGQPLFAIDEGEA
jgi:hypothetical protein